VNLRSLPFAAAFLAFGLGLVHARLAVAQSALTTLQNPGGGHIVYGTVDGASSDAAAIGLVLRSVHQQCQDRPRVGKVFSVRGSASHAVFFSVTKRTQGNIPVAGLIIAFRQPTGRVEAALVTDEAARFGSTVNPMLRTLFGVWHPGGSSTESRTRRSGAEASSAPSLHRVVTTDQSASVGLPDGWTMNPASQFGTILASGPHGERALLGSGLLAMDSNDPRVQRTEAFARGAGRNTTYAHIMYYPYGTNLATAFAAVIQRLRENSGVPPAKIAIATASRLDVPPPVLCASIVGTIDPGDGERSLHAIFCVGAESRMGQYMNVVHFVTIPQRYAAGENAIPAAIIASFSVNQNIVSAQANRMAAPEIARINAIGRRAAQQAAAAHAAEDVHNAAVERHWDSIDRNGTAFTNYLLDQTVVQDSQNNAHGTLWNSEADALVRSDPNRYRYVDTPNFWKGVDY
jgi:uncharacterized membrane protein